ncbi:hypothetical protein NL676_030044 [Syzygium grande]|nr:hypothetical protein NL676_030044 [Syzygium grande]
MDVAVVADALAVMANPESPAIAKLLLLRRSGIFISLSDLSGTAASPLHVSVLMNAVDAVVPPPVRSDPHRTFARAVLRRSRRAKRRPRRSAGGSGEGDGGALDGDGVGDGPFGGGFGFSGGGSGGGGGGQGWNFDGFGGQSWDDSQRRPPWGSGFALDFIYEVIHWIALSKCIHFAFKRVARIAAESMIGDAQRRVKAPARLTAVC